VALYSDAACTKRVTQVKEIKFKNASVSTVTFTNLEKNRIYYVGETDADGNTITRGSVADGETFVTDFANGNQVVTKQGETVGLTFDNCFYTLPREYYKQGTLHITKKLLDADGTPKASEETFYAGIFADEAYTVLSDDVSQNIVPLSLGGGTEVTSETIYTALDENGSKTLYVTEVDAQGNPVDGSVGFIYKMTVDQTSVTIREGSEASVTITNQEIRASEALEDTESYEESIEEDETKEEKQTEQAKSVQTGDETPIGMYTFLLIASALLLFSEERKRRLGRQIER
jgi:hypothetical protein